MRLRGPLLFLAAAFVSSAAALPYRFLVVISDQWKDPASQIIEDPGEFQVLAALLKSWGLPFDILRLDQQRFDRYHLLDRDGRPRYGTILWDAGPGGLEGKGVELLPELVKEHGVNLVVLGDALAVPAAAELAGARYVSDFVSGDNLAAAGAHFITRGLKTSFLPKGKYWHGHKVSATAEVLVTRGPHPFLTAREWPGGGRVAWLGAHRPISQLRVQVVRDLLKRCLVV